MPNVVIPLSSIAQSVSRPVYISMVQQVQKLSNIDPKTKIFFPGEIQSMRTHGSSIDDKDDRFAIFNTDRYTFIEVEDDFDEDNLASTAVEREEHIPIFVDSKLGVRVVPVYASSTVSINFTYRCPSKGECTRWRDEARVRISKLMDINLHKVSYHYQLPIDLIIILQEIHKKREAQYGYGDSFVSYMQSFADPRLTLTGNMVGENERLAIAETQGRIQGFFTWDALPEKAQRDDANGTWSISFTYRFNFDKPIEMYARYPVMVHNQLLDPDFIEFTDKAPDTSKDTKIFSKSFYALNAFESGTLMNSRRKPDELIRLPSYDDYVIPDVVRGTGSVFIALCDVVPTDKRTLLNLDDIGDYCIDEDILKFIRESEYQYLGRNYKSILNLSLYRNGYLTSNESLTCDSSLWVKATKDLDLRNQHRVRLSVNVDITYLDKKALERLKNYPRALVKLIGSMNELLKNNPDFVKMGDKSFITPHDFSDVTSFLTGYRVGSVQGQYMGPGIDRRGLFDGIDSRIVENYRREMISTNRVMTSGIVSMRRQDLP